MCLPIRNREPIAPGESTLFANLSEKFNGSAEVAGFLGVCVFGFFLCVCVFVFVFLLLVFFFFFFFFWGGGGPLFSALKMLPFV